MFNKLFKNIGKLILGLITLVLILVVVAYLTASYWVVPLVNKVVPPITQTSASLQSADISLLKGHFVLKGLKIGNPKGFATENSFKMDEISVQFQPASLMSDKIIVDKILIKGTQISMELNTMGQVNLMVLNENVQNYLGTSTTNKSAPIAKTKATAKNTTKSVIVKDLQILDSSVQYGIVGKVNTLKLPDIQDKNIGVRQKMTLKETVLIVMDKLTTQPVQEIQKASKKVLTNALNYIQKRQGNSETVKELKKSLSQIFG